MSLLSRLFGRATVSANWIEAEALSQRLAGDDKPLIVDVRNPDEFTGPLGHIQGAANVPLPAFGPRAHEFAGQGREIVLVCKTDRRSSAAAEQLRAAGGQRVAVLRGGMERWRALGLP